MLWIFDADDTLRRTIVPGQPSPRAPGEWELLPGVRETFARLGDQSGELRIGIASNQDQVAYGHLSEEMAHRLLADTVAAALGSRTADICIRLCPHTAEVGCECRKPAPGMLLSIIDHFAVPAGDAMFVGNTPGDREAARRAGVPFAWADDFFGRACTVPRNVRR